MPVFYHDDHAALSSLVGLRIRKFRIPESVPDGLFSRFRLCDYCCVLKKQQEHVAQLKKNIADCETAIRSMKETIEQIETCVDRDKIATPQVNTPRPAFELN